MKRVFTIILLIILSIFIIYLGLYSKRSNQPSVYYKVYLEGELIGKIASKEDLEKHINEGQQALKDKFKIDNVYLPKALELKKEISYISNLDKVNDIYEKIVKKSDFTVKGYQITIKGTENSQKIYVLDEKVFNDAVETLIKIYVGTDSYNSYITNTQQEIVNTGTILKNVYVDNEITIKETNIPANETIYTNVTELSGFLLFGDSNKKIHTVKIGDTIEQVAYDYEISVEEFLISNPKYKKSTNMLSNGDEVVIAETSPKLNITVEREITDDYEEAYNTISKIDPSVLIGYKTVTQEGENGILRIKQLEKVVNGTISYIQPISKEELKPPVDRIVVMGSKEVSYIGNIENWMWPTESGWKITSRFSYRFNPFGKGEREFHGAIDIAGPGYGSKIYSANNGTIITMNRDGINGIYIVINHNNGYYTQYNHLSRYANIQVGQVIASGQLIGYMGMTGAATGPHLHFAIWYGGRPFSAGSSRVNPCTIYKC